MRVEYNVEQNQQFQPLKRTTKQPVDGNGEQDRVPRPQQNAKKRKKKKKEAAGRSFSFGWMMMRGRYISRQKKIK